MRLIGALVAVVALVGCEKTFYCEESGANNNSGPRYCYKKAEACGSMDKDVLTGKARDVKCVVRHDAFCRPDPDEGEVCAWSKGECQASMPSNLLDTRTGRPPLCEWEK